MKQFLIVLAADVNSVARALVLDTAEQRTASPNPVMTCEIVQETISSPGRAAAFPPFETSSGTGERRFRQVPLPAAPVAFRDALLGLLFPIAAASKVDLRVCVRCGNDPRDLLTAIVLAQIAAEFGRTLSLVQQSLIEGIRFAEFCLTSDTGDRPDNLTEVAGSAIGVELVIDASTNTIQAGRSLCRDLTPLQFALFHLAALARREAWPDPGHLGLSAAGLMERRDHQGAHILSDRFPLLLGQAYAAHHATSLTAATELARERVAARRAHQVYLEEWTRYETSRSRAHLRRAFPAFLHGQIVPSRRLLELRWAPDLIAITSSSARFVRS